MPQLSAPPPFQLTISQPQPIPRARFLPLLSPAQFPSLAPPVQLPCLVPPVLDLSMRPPTTVSRSIWLTRCTRHGEDSPYMYHLCGEHPLSRRPRLLMPRTMVSSPTFHRARRSASPSRPILGPSPPQHLDPLASKLSNLSLAMLTSLEQ